MVSKQRSILQDPGYDSVREICASLGYNSETKTHRHFKILSTKTANYRKRFVEDSAALTDFPLSNLAPEVQRCASGFLDQHGHLFPSSTEAVAFSWPTYPKDKSKILSGIAKLMCAQEYLRQKNARDKATKGNTNHGLENQSQALFDSTPSTWITSLQDKQLPSQTLRSTLDGLASESESEDDQDIEELRRIIGVHLNDVYPLSHPIDGKASEWLFSSEKCPDDVEPFAFRYLHEHNLYSSKAENIDAIHTFSKVLKQHLSVVCAPSKDHKIFKRCEQLVQRATRKWDAGGYGILTRKNGMIRKTPMFEHAWMHHRRRWIDEVYSGVTDGLLEIPPPFQTLVFIASELTPSTGTKRAAEANDEAQSSRKSKIPSRSIETTIDTQRTENNYTTQLQLPEFTQYGSTRAPEAAMINLSPGAHTQHGSQFSPAIMPSAAVPADKPCDIPLEVNINSTGANLLDEASASPQTSTGTNFGVSGLAGSDYYTPFTIDSPPLLKTEPFSPSPHREILFDGLPATGQRTGSVPSEAQPVTLDLTPPVAERPKLYFAIENCRGMPDTSPSQLVSGPTFRDSSLAGFFELVGSRSNNPPNVLTDITLRYTWINQNAVVVNRHIGEEAWGDIKEDVLQFFRMSREEDSARKRFHVWVRVGDTTKATKNTSSDDI